MVEEIEQSGWLYLDSWIDGQRRRWFQAQSPKKLPNVTLSAEALSELMLCRDMVWHILPETYRKSTSKTLSGATTLLPKFDDRGAALTSITQAKPKGMIDYSAKAEIITTLTCAIRERQFCDIRYRGPSHKRAKRYTVAPYQLIIFHEGLYIRVRPESSIESGSGDKDMTLAIHRIGIAKVLPRHFDPIERQETNSSAGPFGLSRGEEFRVRIRVVPKAAMYVQERIWSDDQEITKLSGGGLLLAFTSASPLETISWVLSFGGEVELLEPEELRSEICKRLKTMTVAHHKERK